MGSGDLGGVGDVEFWHAEAERLATANVVLQTRVAELEDQIGALTEKVSVLARMAFGTSSEKKSPTRPAPDTEGSDTEGSDTEGQGGGQLVKRGRGQRKGSRGHGRRGYSHLPGREEIHDVPEGERVCSCCGAELRYLGLADHDRARRLDPFDHDVVGVGDEVGVGGRPGSGADPFGADQERWLPFEG